MVNVTLLWGIVWHREIVYQAIAASETSSWSLINEYKKTQVKATTTLAVANPIAELSVIDGV